MDITKLNAVPDSSLNLSPVIPSMTGNPAANPAPRIIKPGIAIIKEPAAFNRDKPERINTKEAIIIFLTGTDLRMLPINSRIIIMPATNEDRAKSAFP